MKILLLFSLLLIACEPSRIMSSERGTLIAQIKQAEVYRVEDRDGICYITYRTYDGSHSISCVKREAQR